MTSVMVSKCELADMYLVVRFADGLVLPGEEDALVEELAADVALHAAGVEDLLARLDAVPLHREAARRARVRQPLQQFEVIILILSNKGSLSRRASGLASLCNTIVKKCITHAISINDC